MEWLQDDPVDPALIEVPPRPVTEEDFAGLPVLDPGLLDLSAGEEIGEHRFPADPRAPAFCIYCGVSLEDAARRACGSR